MTLGLPDEARPPLPFHEHPAFQPVVKGSIQIAIEPGRFGGNRLHVPCLWTHFLANTFRHQIRQIIASTMAPRIVFTGGSGKAGRHAIPELIKRGYEVLNVDLTEFPDKEANVFTLKTDLTDSQ